jgi:hypothetical protein
MKYAILTLSCLLFFGFGAAHAQDMVTIRQVTMIDDDKPSLTSEKKEKLSMSISNRAFSGSVFLLAGTPVKVVSRQTYVKQETVGPTANLIKRTFTAGVIEVLDGDHKGKKGWAVIDVQDTGSGKDVYIGQGQGKSGNTTSAQGAADLANSIDLVVSVGAGHISPTGGRLYEVGVVNKGGQVLKGSIEVVVEIDGKVVKTERLRGPLNPNQALSFTLPVGDTDLRKKVKIKATVDPKNAYKEADETNNSATTTASP